MTADTTEDAQVARLGEKIRADLPPPEKRRAIRKAVDANLADIAEEVGVCEDTVSTWERGIHRPWRKHAHRYKQVLDRLEQLAEQRRIERESIRQLAGNCCSTCGQLVIELSAPEGGAD